MYNAIIFDFFGVFCAPIATNWFKKTVPDYAAKLPAFQALCTESDLGKLSRAGFNEAVSKLSGVAVGEVEQGIEAETVIDTVLVAYVQGLKAKGYRIACLSNGSHEFTLKVITDYGLGELFEQVVLSSDLGMVKPDPRIYIYTLEMLQLPASQAIFVDDRKANVDAAEACGIRSLVFSDTQKFIHEFEELEA
jgi:epoxide hydrolase-like predicted phosphatase